MDVVRVGSNIDAWCTKCKLILAHTIEAIASGNIKRVQCNTCRGKHQYKSAIPGQETKSVGAKPKNPPKSKSKPSDFMRLMTGKDPAKAKAYQVTKHFMKGEIINHASFGIGVVVEEKDATKIEVLFSAGAKILIHGRLP